MGFSAALCRGLIEAPLAGGRPVARTGGFPRLYAAASLKHLYSSYRVHQTQNGFPRLYAAASLKPLWVLRRLLRV